MIHEPQPQPHLTNLPILTQTKLKLDSKSKVELASNNTFVANTKYRRGYIIGHYDNDGKLLSKIQVDGFVHFMMASGEVVVVLCQGEDEDGGNGRVVWVRVWELGGKVGEFDVPQIRITKFSVYYMFIFKSTKLFLLCHISQTTLQLFYYKLPLSPQSQPLHTYTIPIEPLTTLTKINEHSMIGIVSSNAASNRFNYYQQPINRNNQVGFRTYSMMRRGIGGLGFCQVGDVGGRGEQEEDGEDYGRLEIKDIWEIKLGVFYVQCENMRYSTRNPPVQTDPNHPPQHYLTFYHNYLKKTTIKSTLSTILPFPHRLQFITSLRMLMPTQQFYSPQQKKPLPKNIPIYYINPITEQLVSKYEGEYHKFGYGYFCWPSYQAGEVLEYQYDFYRSQMNVKVRLYCPTWQGIKMVVTFFMEEIVGFCDQDLLDGVAGMVEEEGQYKDPYAYLENLDKIKTEGVQYMQQR